MLQAMNTGHEGSLSTVHANSPRDALNRLETMVLMAGYELPLRAIRSHVSSALDLVIQLDRLDDGSRRVVEISEVQRMEGEVITLQKLFEFKIDRFDAERRIVGRLHPTGLRPGFLGKFERHGIELPLSLFGGTASAIYGANAAGAGGAGQRGRPMRRRLALLAALVGGHARRRRGCGHTGAGDGSRSPGRSRHPAALPGARLRRQRSGGGARRAQRRGAGERPPRHGCSRRPACEQRSALRRRARAGREREHDRRAGGRGARLRARVRLAPERDARRSASSRSTATSRCCSDLTKDGSALRRALATQPPLAYGTRIHDALMRSLGLLRDAKLSSGSIVLLSDGADIGSLRARQVVAAAKEQRVRIFTVGLRSGAFDAAPLRAIADRTGGSYAEARSAAELAAIYEALGEQLAGEYLVRYRSAARPMSQVEVQVAVAGAGGRPRPTSRRRRRCWLRTTARRCRRSCSPAARRSCSPVLRAARVRAVAPAHAPSEDDGGRPRPELRGRVPRHTGRERGLGGAAGSDPQPLRDRLVGRARARSGARADDGDGPTGRRDGARGHVRLRCRAVFSAPLFGLFGLTTPFIARSFVRRKWKAVRHEFAEQFPGSLQVLASALRSGHSFNGALGVVVDNAHEPARSELARVVQDDRLGVLPEDAMEARPQDGEPRHRAGGTARRAAAHVGRQLRGDPRHGRPHDPRAGRDPPTRQDAHRAGPDGPLDPDGASDLPGGVSLARPPRSDGELLPERQRTDPLVAAAAMVATGSLVIQRIIDIDI